MAGASISLSLICIIFNAKDLFKLRVEHNKCGPNNNKFVGKDELFLWFRIKAKRYSWLEITCEVGRLVYYKDEKLYPSVITPMNRGSVE